MTQLVDKIQEISRNAEDYQAGRKLYTEQKIYIRYVHRFWKDEEFVEAYITEGSIRHETSLKLGTDCIYSAQCTCSKDMNASYRIRDNARILCRHCVALAFQMLDKENRYRDIEVVTSESVKKMLNHYVTNTRKQILEVQQQLIGLEPKLTIDNSNQATLDFKIGSDKKYVVKNLYEFAEALSNEEEVLYGNAFQFVHKRECFDAFSLRLADLILDSVESYKNISQSEMYLYASSVKMRNIKLDLFLADKFMDIMKGHVLLVCEPPFMKGYYRTHNVEKRKLVRDENPKLTLVIEKKGSNGATLRLKEEIRMFFGQKHLYISTQKDFYICDEEYTKNAGTLLKLMKETIDLSDEAFNINEQDLPVFCQAVLPKIEKLFYIETIDMELESFKPTEKKTVFYLDTKEKNIICRVEHHYGNEVFHLGMKEEHVPVSIIRDEFEELRVKMAVEQYFSQEENKAEFHLTETEDSLYALLSQGIPTFMELGEVYVSDSLKGKQVKKIPKMAVGVSLSGNLLELDIDMGGFTAKELLEILERYREKKKFYRLKDGTYVSLEDGNLEVVNELAMGLQFSEKDFNGQKITIPMYRSMFVEEMLANQEQVSLYRSESFKSFIRNIKEVKYSSFEVPEQVSPILRKYQEEGYRWMKTLETYRFGGILADDMGLGKTLQVIALLLDKKKQQEKEEMKETALIVCPASLVYNWEHEFHKFAPHMKVKTVTGTAKVRKDAIANMSSYDAVITSYDLLRRDINLYKEKTFSYEIIDEAQVIKNFSTQNAKAVKSIVAKQRFALTGTPIENRLSELWSIFDFLMPGFLYSYNRFKSEFEMPIVKGESDVILKRFRKMTGPFILRRLKQEVLSDLPEKTEQVMYAQMEGSQKQLYQAAALKLKQELNHVTQEQFNSDRVRVLAALTRLRQICCDPSLCFEDYQDESAKREVCSTLIENSLASGHKVLLFSQFTSMLAIIEQWLQKEKIAYYKLTGDTRVEERMRMVDDFQENEEVSVFLISLKAGGTGLNLTAADTVIHYDPWWNVAAQDQATDRTHRIGQKRPVSVYRIITKGTIEEKILELQESKKDLTQKVLSGESASLGSMSREELIEILS